MTNLEDIQKNTSEFNIGNMFSEVIKHYLGSSFDDEEGD